MHFQAARKDNIQQIQLEMNFPCICIRPLQSLSNFSICFSYVTTLEITYGFTIKIQLLTLTEFESEHNH